MSCDAGCACMTVSGKVSFRMEPLDIGSDGAGHYKLSYRGKQAKLEALSNIGPFYWSDGTERHTLLISSEHQFLWHRLRMDPAPEASIYFLTCNYLQ